MRTKQLVINGKRSFDDFGIYIKERNPSIPVKRKNIRTIAGMHGSYDFSDLYGEIIYEDRIIEYVFDITGWDINDLDIERRKVMDWVLNTNKTKIIDEYSPLHHWVGSYTDGSWKEEAEQGLLTVKFSVYPFAIANNYSELNIQTTNQEKEYLIENTSSHRVIPKIITSAPILIKKGSASINLSAGEWEVESLYLEKGNNSFIISGNSNVCIKYLEEVL